MAQIPNTSADKGMFVPIKTEWNNDAFEKIAIALNLKDTGYYVTTEFVPGNLYYATTGNALNLRQGFRKVITIGALGAGTTNTAHGLSIVAGWQFMHIYGTANNTTTNDYYPIPFAGAAATYISVKLDANNVVIDNASGVSFLDAQITLEYVKS